MLEVNEAPAARVASTAWAISCDLESWGIGVGAASGIFDEAGVGAGGEVDVAGGKAAEDNGEALGAGAAGVTGFACWATRGKARTCSRRSTAC